MAEKPEVNRSQAIRDYFKANPKAKAQEVVDALAKKGITVSVGLVNTVKSKHNQKQAAKKAAKTAAASQPGPSHGQEARSQQDPGRPRLSEGEQEGQEPRKWSMPWQSRASRSRSATSAPSRPSTRRGGGRSRRSSRMSLPKGGVGIPEIKAAFAFLKATGSVAVAKQALAAAVEIEKDRVIVGGDGAIASWQGDGDLRHTGHGAGCAHRHQPRDSRPRRANPNSTPLAAAP